MKHCARLQSGERAYVVSEPATREVGQYVAASGRRSDRTKSASRNHRRRGDARHRAARGGRGAVRGRRRGFLLDPRVDGPHPARRAATDRGTRFLSLPDYSLALLAGESLLADFAGLRPQAEAGRRATGPRRHGDHRSARGAELRLTIAGRKANCCPGTAPARRWRRPRTPRSTWPPRKIRPRA